MCPEHHEPITAVCNADKALLCPSCLTQPGGSHNGPAATAVEHATPLLQQQLGQAYRVILGNPTGHYRLDLSDDTFR